MTSLLAAAELITMTKLGGCAKKPCLPADWQPVLHVS